MATTLPAMAACTSVSIFIASVISTAWPAFTVSPSLTSTSTMLPGMVVLTWPGALACLRLLLPPPTNSLSGSNTTSSGMPSIDR
ncbi:hypothetical protein D3C80_2112440 [compost metagenome]